MLLLGRPPPIFIKRILTRNIQQQQQQQKAAFMLSQATTSLILVDFDQTITTKDTIELLGQFGVSQSQQNTKPWSYFVDTYLKDYITHRDQLPKLPQDNSDLSDYIDQLNSYRPIESASLARVSTHKVFHGLTRQDLFQQATKLSDTVLHPGVISALQPYNVRIVSLNWSKDWILGFMHELHHLKKEHIYSNDLAFEDDVCTGDIVPQILTTVDKQQLVTRCIANTHKRIIYIGDSTGDIEPLVKSDIGIIIGNDTSLLKALNDFGYTVEQDDLSKSSQLYRVDTWGQIKLLLEKYT